MFKFFILLALLLPLEAFSNSENPDLVKIFPTPLGFTKDYNRAWWISYSEPKNVRQLFGETTTPINFLQLCQNLLEKYKLHNNSRTTFVRNGIKYDWAVSGLYGPTKRTNTGVQYNKSCQFYWKGTPRGDIPAIKSPGYYIAR